jgi:hypothetical protein
MARLLSSQQLPHTIRDRIKIATPNSLIKILDGLEGNRFWNGGVLSWFPRHPWLGLGSADEGGKVLKGLGQAIARNGGEIIVIRTGYP